MSPKRKRPPFLPSLHPSKVRTARSVFSGMERFRRAILCPCAFERLYFKTATCPPSIFLREEAFALRHFRSAPRPPVGNACGVAQGLRNENGISGCRGAVRRTRASRVPGMRNSRFSMPDKAVSSAAGWARPRRRRLRFFGPGGSVHRCVLPRSVERPRGVVPCQEI